MWPFRKPQPKFSTPRGTPISRIAPEELVSRNRRMLANINKHETDAFTGDMFPIKKEVTNMNTQVTTHTVVDVEKLPELVGRSVGTLKGKKAGIENDLKVLKQNYDEARNAMNDKLKLVNTSIKAWEAAQAIYKDAEAPTIEHKSDEAVPTDKPVRKTQAKK